MSISESPTAAMPQELVAMLEDAEAKVAHIKRVLAGAPCREVGHRWVFHGGCACNCPGGGCSFPVHECSHCGDCDYGENEEAGAIRQSCLERAELEA